MPSPGPFLPQVVKGAVLAMQELMGPPDLHVPAPPEPIEHPAPSMATALKFPEETEARIQRKKVARKRLATHELGEKTTKLCCDHPNFAQIFRRMVADSCWSYSPLYNPQQNR